MTITLGPAINGVIRAFVHVDESVIAPGDVASVNVTLVATGGNSNASAASVLRASVGLTVVPEHRHPFNGYAKGMLSDVEPKTKYYFVPQSDGPLTFFLLGRGVSAYM